MADPYGAFGAVLKKGSTPVAQVSNIGGPGLSLDTIDVTAHDSEDAWREYVAGLIDAGEVSLDLFFDPANATHQALHNDLGGRTKATYTLEFPDTATTAWTFDAFVTAFEPTAPVDGALTATATLKLTGKPTLPGA